MSRGQKNGFLFMEKPGADFSFAIEKAKNCDYNKTITGG